MKKVLLPVLLAVFGLAGCVAVPYGGGPGVYAAPAVSFGFYGGGHHGHGGHGHRGGHHRR